ncbi:hypothetical protein [Streptomyces sp. SM11]|uniref:hypothetical protein n=1 Tax=Streptomyces sp. SM11 TaxID=565557 RepID=UPI000CD5462F|nr:hypothetical protein [Streptomyces sp. SM11]
MKRYTASAVVTVAVLMAAGCSSDSADKKPKADPTAAVLTAARSYQEAQNAEDWQAVCKLRSERLRFGTVETCVEDNTPGKPSPSPTDAQDAAPSPYDEPPRYADGSTPRPRATRTTGGPDRADLGPVEASDVVEVPAGTEHPAGYGVMVTYTVQWPGKPPTTSLRALRLIKESGAWAVDQTEDVSDADVAHGSAVLTALSGG